MNGKERKRMVVFENVIQNAITLKEASKLLNLSYRQAIRIKKDYIEFGAKSLVHRNRGKPSHRKKEESFKQKAIALYREKYPDFGPTFASEKLKEDDKISINPETLRLWLIKAGIWTRKRKRATHRQRRERKANFGEMIQFDGSHHAWFEGAYKRTKMLFDEYD